MDMISEVAKMDVQDEQAVVCMKRIIERYEAGVIYVRATTVLSELYYAFFERLLKEDQKPGAGYQQDGFDFYDPCADDSETWEQEIKDNS